MSTPSKRSLENPAADKVNKWRADNMLEDNQDFAYFYTEFEEAYGKAGKAVAMAWLKARALVVPGMASDMAKISKVESKVAKIRREFAAELAAGNIAEEV